MAIDHSHTLGCYKSLSPHHLDILEHAIYRAAHGRYCGGGGETMNDLVDIGLMEYVGKPSWYVDHVYKITEKGRSVMTHHRRRTRMSTCSTSI